MCTGDNSVDGADKGSILRAQRQALKKHVRKALANEGGGDRFKVTMSAEEDGALSVPYEPCAEDFTVP